MPVKKRILQCDEEELHMDQLPEHLQLRIWRRVFYNIDERIRRGLIGRLPKFMYRGIKPPIAGRFKRYLELSSGRVLCLSKNVQGHWTGVYTRNSVTPGEHLLMECVGWFRSPLRIWEGDDSWRFDDRRRREEDYLLRRRRRGFAPILA